MESHFALILEVLLEAPSQFPNSLFSFRYVVKAFVEMHRVELPLPCKLTEQLCYIFSHGQSFARTQVHLYMYSSHQETFECEFDAVSAAFSVEHSRGLLLPVL